MPLLQPIERGTFLTRQLGCARFFFFFQAEDGIRDDLATGVQTCALPICRSAVRRRIVDRARLALAARTDLRADDDSRWSRPYHALSGSRFMAQRILDRDRDRGRREIGRASCRERCRSRWSPYH